MGERVRRWGNGDFVDVVWDGTVHSNVSDRVALDGLLEVCGWDGTGYEYASKVLELA